MKTTNTERVKKFQQKKQHIKRALKTDFNNLVIEIEYMGEIKRSLIGLNTPLLSFSTLVRGLNQNRYQNIPKKNLELVANVGKNVMENIEVEFFGGDYLHTDEKIIKTNGLIKEWLALKGFEIKAVEKMFISQCNKYYGYIDLICFDSMKKEYVMIEIKTRGKNFREIDNLTKAQAQFYKESFYNIRTYILCVNRDYDYSKKDTLKSNWKYMDFHLSGRYLHNFLQIIKAYNDIEGWEKYNYISLKKV